MYIITYCLRAIFYTIIGLYTNYVLIIVQNISLWDFYLFKLQNRYQVFLTFLFPIDIFKVVLTQLPGQELTLEVFDRDMDMKDDFMGRYEGCCQYNP